MDFVVAAAAVAAAAAGNWTATVAGLGDAVPAAAAAGEMAGDAILCGDVFVGGGICMAVDRSLNTSLLASTETSTDVPLLKGSGLRFESTPLLISLSCPSVALMPCSLRSLMFSGDNAVWRCCGVRFGVLDT